MGGENLTLEEACRELERIMKENQILKATNEAYSAAEKSENDVWRIALKDMSSQLQVAASERAACQAAMLKLQECALVTPWLTNDSTISDANMRNLWS